MNSPEMGNAPGRRVDTHVHILPADYRAEVEQRATVRFALQSSSRDLLEEFMARHRIDAAVLSLSQPGVWFGDQALANELSRMVNERTAELVRSSPSRFAGLAFLPLPDVPSALDELAYALDELQLDGVTLLSNIAGTYHGDPAWDPLWMELERRSAYVMLHPAVPPHALPIADHPMWLYEFPFDTTRAVVNLIYSGTLSRSPSVHLQLAHLGGTVPFLAHRIASLQAREPGKATGAPRGAVAELARLYYDTGLSNNQVALEATRSLASLDRIVFGTDWPYADLPESGDPAPGLAFLGSDRMRVDGENAAALVPRFAG